MGGWISSSVGGGDVAHSGSATIAIAWHSQKKGLGKFLTSDPFDIGGHRWYIGYYPDGNPTQGACAGWIGFYLYLYHNNPAGVDATFKFTLVDEFGDQPVPSYSTNGDTRTFKDRDIGWGYPKLITRNALEESAYLKDVSKGLHTEVTSQFVTVPPTDMNQHIGRLLSSGVDADVPFQVGEEKFSTHRLMLGTRSSVFMAELLGPMRERNSHIRIDDMEPRVFRAMLHFIYTDEFPKMDNGDTFAMTQHLFVVADRYDLQRLKLMCEQKLCECISTITVTTTLGLAEQHGCKGLKEACFKFLKSPGHLKKIMDSDEFQHLTSSCPSLLNELLANDAP